MRLGALLILLICLCACALPRSQPTLMPTNVDAGLAEQVAWNMVENQDAVRTALVRSLEHARSQDPQANPLQAAGISSSWARIADTLQHLLDVLPRLAAEPELLAAEFAWYRVRPQPLITGYYEPEIAASLTPDPAYPVPLHGVPPTLKSVDLGRFHPRWAGQTLLYRQGEDGIEPFYSRAEIDAQGALDGQGTPVAWAKDWADVFFLQIQGSGRLRLPDGSSTHILYAGKNGREYVSLGKVMLERGLMTREDMSMQGLRAYLRAHPESARELMHTNPSYVFFRLADSGPLGSMGHTLTPMVSVATDPTFLPLGAVVALDVVLPDSDGEDRPTQLLGLAQDQGGAIKGVRMDLFCGAGAQAEHIAGHVQTHARAYVLLKQ